MDTRKIGLYKVLSVDGVSVGALCNFMATFTTRNL